MTRAELYSGIAGRMTPPLLVQRCDFVSMNYWIHRPGCPNGLFRSMRVRSLPRAMPARQASLFGEVGA